MNIKKEILEGTEPLNEMEPLRQKALIDLNKKVNEPPVLLQVQCSGEYHRFATTGNFSLIIGKAKSRKTFFLALLIASLIQPQDDE